MAAGRSRSWTPLLAGIVAESADDAGWGAIEFAADESGGASQLVGNGFDAGFQFVAVGIAAAPVVAQGLESRDADCEFRQSFAPGAAEAVGDDDGNRKSGTAFEGATKIGCRAVCIFGKQQRVAASVDVGDVDAAVGAQEAVVRLGDEDAVLAADDRATLA